jgi:hypothetical protein
MRDVSTAAHTVRLTRKRNISPLFDRDRSSSSKAVQPPHNAWPSWGEIFHDISHLPRIKAAVVARLLRDDFAAVIYHAEQTLANRLQG